MLRITRFALNNKKSKKEKEKNKMSMPIEKDYPNSMEIMDIAEA